MRRFCEKSVYIPAVVAGSKIRWGPFCECHAHIDANTLVQPDKFDLHFFLISMKFIIKAKLDIFRNSMD